MRSAFGKTWKMRMGQESLFEGEEAIGLFKRARACLEKSVDLGRKVQKAVRWRSMESFFQARQGWQS